MYIDIIFTLKLINQKHKIKENINWRGIDTLQSDFRQGLQV